VGGLFEVHFSYTGTEVMILILLMFSKRGDSIIFFEKKVGKIFSSSKWPQKHIHTCRSHTRISIYNIIRQIFLFAHFLNVPFRSYFFFFFQMSKLVFKVWCSYFYLSKFAKIMNCPTTLFIRIRSEYNI